jgi:maltooligosyltrehalose trehalohydrolase
LTDGEIERVSVLFDETERWLTMTRGRVLVTCNFADAPRIISCAAAKDKTMVLLSEDGVVVEKTTLMLPAQSVAILVG